MAELEIDKEDVHDRRKCCEDEVQPYRKTDYNVLGPLLFLIMIADINKDH